MCCFYCFQVQITVECLYKQIGLDSLFVRLQNTKLQMCYPKGIQQFSHG